MSPPPNQLAASSHQASKASYLASGVFTLLLQEIASCLQKGDLNETKLLATNLLRKSASLEEEERITILLEVARLYDSIGDNRDALEMANGALSIAESIGSLHFLRQVYNTLGMLHYRSNAFDLASRHFIRALEYARKEDSSVYEFAILANVSCLLNSIGLAKEALQLSRQLSIYPTTSDSYLRIHFQNSVNAIKFGFAAQVATDDLRVFYDELKGVRQLGYKFNDLESAYFFSSCALYNLRLSRHDRAYALLKNALRKRRPESNPRAIAVLFHARALCALETKDSNVIVASIESLANILPALEKCPEHYEESLYAMVALYEELEKQSVPTIGSLKVAMLLRKHLIVIKQGIFVDSIADTHHSRPHGIGRSFLEGCGQLGWLNDLRKLVSIYLDSQEESGSLVVQDHLPSLARLISRRSKSEFDKKYRTDVYDRAENWAMAAELRSGGSMARLRVSGLLGYLLAKASGGKEVEAVRIGMACRLRDLGLLAIGVAHLPALDDIRFENLVAREHAILAADMLAQTGDPGLRKLVGIIRHHHEWWNGCGFPDGLRGEGIPFGSRICAYVDSFVTLLIERPIAERWSIDEAKNQIECMGGVQLDPSLFLHFERVLIDNCEKLSLITEFD